MKEFTDKELDNSIAQMLRAGVILSAVIVVIGGILYLRRGTLHLDAVSIIQLGLLVLIATPVARVAMCIAGFARQRDKIYVGISIGVFVILMYSLIRGGR